MVEPTTISNTTRPLDGIVNLAKHSIDEKSFRIACKQSLDSSGVLVLPDFLRPDVVEQLVAEGRGHNAQAYYTADDHNVYLKPTDTELPDDHPRNRLVSSTKGCITTDQLPADSHLRSLYDSQEFKNFLCAVLGEEQLFEYADSLSSINFHYASEGQELGWHFDNSSFAITLLIQKPEAGAVFEYVKDVRDADLGDMSFDKVNQILDGAVPVNQLAIDPGSLVLFRGRNSIHRVTPTLGNTTRMLVVLAYNTRPNIALSESARMTFYGRLG